MKIIKLLKLGWTQQEIAEVVGIDRTVISRIVQNANFGEMHTLLTQGRDMAYIADHYQMDLALAWAVRVEAVPTPT